MYPFQYPQSMKLSLTKCLPAWTQYQWIIPTAMLLYDKQTDRQ